jgi:glycine/D-amino acid oxidase-like deaminating enzyme
LDRDELRRKFPLIDPGPAAWGIWESGAGLLMARRAVQAVVTQARAIGVEYEQAQITPDTKINAEHVVFACGPWLPRVFPELLGELIYVTKQEVVFFGVPAGDERFGPESMPAWIDFNDLVYGIPNVDGRGSSWLSTRTGRSLILTRATALCRRRVCRPRASFWASECRC